MAPKIFMTGVTGYIGGSVFAGIVKAHPDYELTVLLRTIPSGFEAKYPHVKIARGSFDSAAVLEAAAEAAEIVIHCGDSDYLPAVQSLLSGLSRRSTPGTYIHLSGTAIVSDVYFPEFHGKHNPRVWSDIDDIAEITALPDSRIHRPVDKHIQAVGATGKVKTLIMCPPDIWGLGSGPGKTQSFLVALFVSDALKIGGTFMLEEGQSRRSWIGIKDLVRLYLEVLEEVVAGGAKLTFGREGFYFTAAPETHISQKELAEATGRILQKKGLLKSAEPKVIGKDELVALANGTPMGIYMFGANSRSRADRAKKELGFEAQEGVDAFFASLESEVEASLNTTERAWGFLQVK